MQSPKKVFQLTPEGEEIILTNFPTEKKFDKKVDNTGSDRFILTTKFYTKPKNTTPLSTKNENPEEKSDVETLLAYVKKKEKTTTKQ